MRFFITGTDTNCGKTYVTCQLLNFLHQHQRSALGLKPVASGCLLQNGSLVSEDVESIKIANASSLDICHKKYLPPIAPHLAAEQVGESFTAASLADFCNGPEFSAFEYLLIEGAGGLMVPLNVNVNETWLDLIEHANLAVIVVVGMRLGCLNHALLTAAALTAKAVKPFGWIANCLDPAMLALEENIETLKVMMPFPWLGTIPYRGACSKMDILLQA